MESNKLGKLHETLLEILDYVVSVCEENGLQYVLVYGTALGAYRHKGFIPWDDDLDIALPRKDYEKLIEIMKKSEQKKYLIQNESNEKRYYLPFSKVRKAGTLFAESIAQGMYSNNGIFIDIFPLFYHNFCILSIIARHNRKHSSSTGLILCKEFANVVTLLNYL